MKIMPNRMDRGFYRYQEEFEQKALEVLRSGWYVLGKEVAAFEEEFASYTGGKYCVGLASGLDALWIAFRLLGIGKGDEVIVQGNTYIASVFFLLEKLYLMPEQLLFLWSRIPSSSLMWTKSRKR